MQRLFRNDEKSEKTFDYDQLSNFSVSTRVDEKWIKLYHSVMSYVKNSVLYIWEKMCIN